jgi:hypothetical protein
MVMILIILPVLIHALQKGVIELGGNWMIFRITTFTLLLLITAEKHVLQHHHLILLLLPADCILRRCICLREVLLHEMLLSVLQDQLRAEHLLLFLAATAAVELEMFVDFIAVVLDHRL